MPAKWVTHAWYDVSHLHTHAHNAQMLHVKKNHNTFNVAQMFAITAITQAPVPPDHPIS